MVRREVKFFVRVFPTEERDLTNFKIEIGHKTIYIRAPQDFTSHRKKFYYWEFNTDNIFCNACQKDVYSEIVDNTVVRALNGANELILAYGPSDTGKTYTVTGLRGNYEHRGIVPRIISEIFSKKKNLEEVTHMKIFLSYLEFTEGEVKDLLKNQKIKKKRSCPKVKCNSESEALRYIFEGASRRRYENNYKSCSTTVITIHLDVIWINKVDSNFTTKIHIIDTAGVENIPSSVRSDKCQIIANMALFWINYVLATGNLLTKKVENGRLVIRTCPLTDFIGPALINGNIKLIAHVRLTTDNLQATLNALRFGAAIKKYPSPELVYENRPNHLLLIQSLKEENRHLKDELLMNELLQGEYTEKNMSQEEVKNVTRLVDSYLQGRVTGAALLSTVKNTVLLPIIRNSYLKEVAQLKSKIERYENQIESKSTSGKKGGKGRNAHPVSSKMTFSSKSKRDSQSIRRSKSFSSKGSSRKSSLRNLLADSQFQIVDEADSLVKNALWLEFFQYNPTYYSQLKVAQINVEEALKEKEDTGKEAVKLRCKLDDVKLALEDVIWQRKAKIGNTIGPDGKEIQTDAEKQAEELHQKLTDEFLKARETSILSHSKFMAKAREFNDLNEIVKLEFEDYINKTYTTTLIVPEVDQEPFKIYEPLMDENITDKDIPDQLEENAKLYFEHLQSFHGKNLITNTTFQLCWND